MAGWTAQRPSVSMYVDGCTTNHGINNSSGIAHAAAPERERALRGLVEHERPQAQIEIATTLGSVVGTHAGPGTVGFFWFLDG